MRCWSIALVVLAAASSAHASSRCHGRCGPLPLLVELSLGAEQLSLADRTFIGSGEPAGLDGKAIAPSTTVRVDGRTLGVGKPLVASWQLHHLWLTPYHLAFGGILGGIAGDSGRGVTPVDGQSVGSSIGGITAGPEIAAVFAHGPFELRAGVALGYRSVQFPITSFVRVPCGKGGRCYPTASDAEFFFEPRASIGVNLGSVQLGAYAGGDLMATGGWSAGGFVALALPDWRARAEVRPITP